MWTHCVLLVVLVNCLKFSESTVWRPSDDLGKDNDEGDYILRIDENGNKQLTKEPPSPWDQISRNGSEHSHPPTNRIEPRKAIEEGDVCSGRWTNGHIPYRFHQGDNALDTDYIPLIQDAIEMFEGMTCLTFEDITDDPSKWFQPHIRFETEEYGGCKSLIGMSCSSDGEGQFLNLDSCKDVPVIMHEIGHALGLFHEQQRPDRDQFVRIEVGNVEADSVDQFEIYTDSVTYGVPYDYYSIMHYGKNTFSRESGLATIKTIDPLHQFVIGSPPEPSHFDLMIINIMYSCNAHCATPPVCQNDGFVDHDCVCRCPHHTSGDYCESVNGPYYLPLYDECGDQLIESDTEIKTLNYPNAHGLHKCMWYLKAPPGKKAQVHFLKFEAYDHKKCKVDYVQIFQDLYSWDERICGTTLDGQTIEAEDNSLVLFWRTGFDGGNTGFKASVTFVDSAATPTTSAPGPGSTSAPSGSDSTPAPPGASSTLSPPVTGPPPAPPTEPQPEECFREIQLSEEEVIIQSKDYPKGSGVQRCEWLIKNEVYPNKKRCINIKIVDMDIPNDEGCSKAYIKVDGKGEGNFDSSIRRCKPFQVSGRGATSLLFEVLVDERYKGFQAHLSIRACILITQELFTWHRRDDN